MFDASLIAGTPGGTQIASRVLCRHKKSHKMTGVIRSVSSTNAKIHFRFIMQSPLSIHIEKAGASRIDRRREIVDEVVRSHRVARLKVA